MSDPVVVTVVADPAPEIDRLRREARQRRSERYGAVVREFELRTGRTKPLDAFDARDKARVCDLGEAVAQVAIADMIDRLGGDAFGYADVPVADLEDGLYAVMREGDRDLVNAARALVNTTRNMIFADDFMSLLNALSAALGDRQ